MPTPEELLHKLEERFILGEISEETYKQLKASLLARQGSGTGGPPEGGTASQENPAAGPISVADSVIKGDVGTNKGAASVGNILINVSGGQTPAHAASALLVCPFCGRRNKPEDVFRCRKCGVDHLCVRHFVDQARMCQDCFDKEAEARREAEEERKRQEEELKRQAAAKPRLQVYSDWPFDAAEAKRRQEETARALGIPVEKDIDLGKGVKLRLGLIPAGEFDMGSPPGEAGRTDDETLHRVRITRPFHVGKYPVTQQQ